MKVNVEKHWKPSVVGRTIQEKVNINIVVSSLSRGMTTRRSFKFGFFKTDIGSPFSLIVQSRKDIWKALRKKSLTIRIIYYVDRIVHSVGWWFLLLFTVLRKSYNSVEVSGHNVERSQTWVFRILHITVYITKQSQTNFAQVGGGGRGGKNRYK